MGQGKGRLWLAALGLLYLGLASFQLGLPGLHYDEAREAGVNAMELLTGAPVTAFRGAVVAVGNLHLPLMVQDYIGALNVYLALPFLALTGIGVPNLRALPVLTGLATLFLLERAVSSWVAIHATTPSPDNRSGTSAWPVSQAGILAVALLAASPTFVFWSRQGIFVTNLTQPFTLLCIWQGLTWLQGGRARSLLLAALAGGCALYAKLLAIWVVGPFLLWVGLAWLWRQQRTEIPAPPLSLPLAVGAVLAFLLPLVPLFLFNLQTGGTWEGVAGRLVQSYYGVDNRAIGQNLMVRWGQLQQILRGDQLWYLGGVYGNRVAPWLAAVAVVGALLGPGRRLVMGPLILLTAGFAMSLVTISDLFVTHYALLQPLVVATVACALHGWTFSVAWPRRQTLARGIVVALAALWLLVDVAVTLQYHQALARSGGLADHSDASYHLAYYLQYNGLGAPIALDWGMDATVRFLSQGTVRPIEIFGYERLDGPDAGFVQRLEAFLQNRDNVYLLHAPGQTVFQGRREAWMAEAAARGLQPVLLADFRQRDGTPVYELWRVVAP
ncbi:MAG: hypothetical protein KatS3mg050_1574 [Litorilinea sp.]|nr:MAG: hypothetical protein KatS3mg050_1574 [Litorilinea sp.]